MSDVTMSPKEMTTIRIAPELLDAMRQLKDGEGIPMAVQVDRALREWLPKRGIVVKAERKRVAARKRS
ncbi:MAG: hypothetical protein AB7Q29_11645 [Vicinamibacterales bacterium]